MTRCLSARVKHDKLKLRQQGMFTTSQFYNRNAPDASSADTLKWPFGTHLLLLITITSNKLGLNEELQQHTDEDFTTKI